MVSIASMTDLRSVMEYWYVNRYRVTGALKSGMRIFYL